MPQALSAILDAVLDEVGFARESAYAAGTGVSARSLVALANRCATTIRTLPLTKRRVLGTISLTAATSYSLPTDFFEYVPDTAFITGNINPVRWPTPEDEWRLYQAGGLAPGAVMFVRQYAGALAVLNPINGASLTFEYLSSYTIALTATPTVAAKERFTLDTDVWLLDDELLKLDVVWRFMKQKGLDWQPAALEFAQYVRELIGRENGAITLDPHMGQTLLAEPYSNLWRA